MEDEPTHFCEVCGHGTVSHAAILSNGAIDPDVIESMHACLEEGTFCRFVREEEE